MFKVSEGNNYCVDDHHSTENGKNDGNGIGNNRDQNLKSYDFGDNEKDGDKKDLKVYIMKTTLMMMT